MPGLGKGLFSLISQDEALVGTAVKENQNAHPSLKTTNHKSKSSNFLIIDIDTIVTNPFQPRKIFDPEELEALTNSIKEHGVLQPILVTAKPNNTYELVAGERRFRASKILNLKTIPVIILDINKDVDKLALSLIENIQRQNLNPIEKAMSYKKLIDDFDFTQQDLALKLGLSRPVVANSIRLLNLPQTIQDALSESKISEAHGRLILSVNDVTSQLKLFQRIIDTNATIKDTENLIIKIHPTVTRQVINTKTNHLQNLLENILGTKVKIRQYKNNEGDIVINFYSEEELNRIITLLTQKTEHERV